MDTRHPAKTQDAAEGKPADGQTASPEALQAGHETTDVSLKGLTIFGFALLVKISASPMRRGRAAAAGNTGASKA